jgi:hypothetical protein
VKPGAPPRAEIGLNIGSLALPGYSARDGARLAGAFERELGRLLATAELPQRGLETPLLRLPAWRPAANESPERTGRRLARALVQGLSR